ncbi:MAG TPA: Mth938-like domain-containing protein [Longimicrobiales bacterium]|nr:Mth938-like domain-containing protein [Longimicrobiales bacterium]
MTRPHPDPSPRIRHLSWGRLEVEDPDGVTRRYKDAKLFPGGSRTWDWNETGTSHEGGIQPADVDELLEHGAEAVVLSRGMNRRLRVAEATLKRLQEAGVAVDVLPTDRAAERYGELRDEKAVAGLFHSTC